MSGNQSRILVIIFIIVMVCSVGYAVGQSPISGLKGDINRINSENIELQSQVSELTSQNNDLLTRLENITANMTAIQSSLQTLYEKYHDTSKAYISTQSTIENILSNYGDINTQLLEAKENNTILARAIANLTAEYNLLLSEKEYYKENYEQILVDYIELLASYQIPYCGTFSNCDNFNDYWEIDPDDTIAVSQNKISWNNMDRSMGRQLWREYDLGLTGAFVHRFTFCIQEIEAGDDSPREIVRLWTLKSGEVSIMLYAEQVDSNDNLYNLVFFQRSGSGNTFLYYSSVLNNDLEVGEVYYATVSKHNDIYRLFVFDDSNILVDSGPFQGISVDYETLSVVSIGGYSDDLEDWSTGYIENLRIFNTPACNGYSPCTHDYIRNGDFDDPIIFDPDFNIPYWDNQGWIAFGGSSGRTGRAICPHPGKITQEISLPTTTATLTFWLLPQPNDEYSTIHVYFDDELIYGETFSGSNDSYSWFKITTDLSIVGETHYLTFEVLTENAVRIDDVSLIG